MYAFFGDMGSSCCVNGGDRGREGGAGGGVTSDRKQAKDKRIMIVPGLLHLCQGQESQPL